MRIYLAYRFSGIDKEDLKKQLEKISQALIDIGHKPFVFCRDVQNWGKVKMTKKEVIKACLPEVKKSDAFFIFLNSEEKSEGMLIEAGFAKANHKEIILAIKKGINKHWLFHLAEKIIEFEDIDDLQNKIRENL